MILVLPLSYSVPTSSVDICDSFRIHVLSIRLSFIIDQQNFRFNTSHSTLNSSNFYNPKVFVKTTTTTTTPAPTTEFNAHKWIENYLATRPPAKKRNRTIKIILEEQQQQQQRQQPLGNISHHIYVYWVFLKLPTLMQAPPLLLLKSRYPTILLDQKDLSSKQPLLQESLAHF